MAYLTKKQEGERFLAEFLRRLREAPPGTAGGASTHGTAAGTALASGPAYVASRSIMSCRNTLPSFNSLPAIALPKGESANAAQLWPPLLFSQVPACG